MGRRPGSKNKSKSGAAKATGAGPATTEHAKAAAKTDLTDDQLQALTAHHASAYTKALEAKKTADANFKNICKLAKAEGVKLDAIKLYIDIVTPEGQARVKEMVETAARIARWRGADLGTQFKLFDDGDTNSFTAGKEAGMAGDPLKVPAGRDIEEFARGWHAGQKLKMDSFKALQGTRDAEFEAAAPAQESEPGEEPGEGEPDAPEAPGAEPAETQAAEGADEF